jgi:hypothetical protein
LSHNWVRYQQSSVYCLWFEYWFIFYFSFGSFVFCDLTFCSANLHEAQLKAFLLFPRGQEVVLAELSISAEILYKVHHSGMASTTVGFSKISIFWLIWVLSTSKRTKKKIFSISEKNCQKNLIFKIWIKKKKFNNFSFWQLLNIFLKLWHTIT